MIRNLYFRECSYYRLLR